MLRKTKTSGKGTKRKEQAQETKARIYNAAIELMDRKGFENLTIMDISRKAGVSAGSFYNHFSSKVDILTEIFRKGDDYFLDKVAPAIEGKRTTEQILEFFDHYALFNLQSGVENTQALYNPKIKLFISKSRPMWAILARVIAAGQESGEIKDDEPPKAQAEFLFTLARGIVFDWGLYDGRYDLRRKMRHYIAAVVAAMAK